MANKERNQNPLVGDTVKLKFFTFNGGNFSDPHEVVQVEIYKLFATAATDDNPFGRVLVETISADDIVRDDDGKYHVDVALTAPKYTQGRFQDDWHIIFEEDTPTAISPMDFLINPNAWFTDSLPIVHDFSFSFRPNRVPKGSKKYIEIKVTPNVPRGTDKQRYYENMAAAGEIYISIEQKCGPCVPAECDLRLVVEDELITERDGCVGYYLLDTTEMDCGVYDVWFKASLGPNIFISEKNQLQIY